LGKKNSIFENIPIESIGAEGKAIAHVEGKIIFLRNVVPGDIVDVRIKKDKKAYFEGEAVKIKSLSPLRINPLCKYFGLCGGCAWQILDYQQQLKYKEKQVVDQFERIGKIEVKEIFPIIPSPKTIEYRNKIEYSFSDNCWISKEEIESRKKIDRRGSGFHIREYFNRIVNIDKCYLQPEPSNTLRNAIKDFAIKNNYTFYNPINHKGFLRSLIVRTSLSNEVMIILIFGEQDDNRITELLSYIKNYFPQISSIYYAINTKFNDSLNDITFYHYYGEKYIKEKIENITFYIGPKSFFQTNTLQTINLYNKIKEFLKPNRSEIIYDLYCGTGTIGLFLAKSVKKVVGIEIIPEAIEDANLNAKINNITNAKFYQGDVVDILTYDFTKNNEPPDIIIVDPPRSGLHKKLINSIIKILPEKIIYVSCNPATQARDINMLKNYYDLKFIQPFDMFPHTHHVENLVLLSKK